MKRIKTLLLTALQLLGVVGLYFLLQLLLTTVYTNHAPTMPYPVALLNTQATALICTLLTALVFVRWREHKPLSVLRAGFKPGWLRHWGAGAGIGIASVTLVWGIIALLGGYAFSMEPNPANIAPWIPVSLLTMMLVGYSEELLCRGIMAYVGRRAGRATVAFMVGILFSLMHGFNPNVSVIGLTNTLLVALALSVMTWLSRDLWLAIGFHTAWNFWMCSALGVPVSGLGVASLWHSSAVGDDILTGGAYGLEGSLVCTIVFLLGLALLYRLLHQRRISLSSTNWIA